MPENDPNPELTQNEPEPTSPSTEPASGDAQDEQFRMPLDSPQHLRGKTAQEIVEWSDGVSDQVRTLYAQQAQTPQQPTTLAPTQALDPDLILTNPEEYQRQMIATINAQQSQNLAAAAQPIINAQADTARFMSQHDKSHEETWDRWSHDIDMQVANIPANLRTKALYDQAAKIVKADHIDEIVDERAQALASAGSGLDTGSTFLGEQGDYQAQSSDEWDKFDQSSVGRHLMSTLGKRKIMEMCEAHNMTISEYADMVAANKAEVDPHRGTIDNYDLHLGG